MAALTANLPTFELGGGTHAAFLGSPGGIVFVSDRDGSAQVYEMYRDGSGQTKLTDAPDTNFAPTWSAHDEENIFDDLETFGAGLSLLGAFDVFKIYRMDADGENEISLTDESGAGKPGSPPAGG